MNLPIQLGSLNFSIQFILRHTQHLFFVILSFFFTNFILSYFLLLFNQTLFLKSKFFLLFILNGKKTK